MQLRTDRIGLAAYFNKINRRESARCECDLGKQTIKHILLKCPLLDELLRQTAAAPIVAEQVSWNNSRNVDSVATGEETGEEDNEP